MNASSSPASAFTAASSDSPSEPRSRQPAAGAPAASPITAEERESLRQQGVLITTFNDIYNWGRSNSIWPLQFGLACCAIEMIAVAAARFDIARFGAEIFRASPRQADLMIVSGTVTKKMAPQVVRIWNQMAEPKYCIAMGACSISGGPFKQGYNVLKGVDRFIPVDLYIPGCPPRPEALLNGLVELQKKMRAEKITGPDRARHLRNDDDGVYPVPKYGEHDLVPTHNSAVWRPSPPLVRPAKP